MRLSLSLLKELVIESFSSLSDCFNLSMVFNELERFGFEGLPSVDEQEELFESKLTRFSNTSCTSDFVESFALANIF